MKNNEKLANDIYDLIKECFLDDRQNDTWAQLSRKHAKEARQDLKKMSRYISIADNKITIGERKPLIITVK